MTEQQPAGRRQLSTPVKLATVVAGLATALTVMVLAFATPSVNSGAHDLPIGISGTDTTVAQVRASLTSQMSGVFDVTAYDDAATLRPAILDRDEVGGLSIAQDGSVDVLTATAAGASYASVLKTVGAALTAGGQTVAYEELVPYTDDDPMGAGLSALALPLVFGGMISSVVLALVLKGIAVPLRLATGAAFALVAGLVVTALLQFGFGSLDGSYLLTALCVALGIAAINFPILGLQSLLGTAGIGIGALVMMFVANPLSGFATGPAWLPSPWGAIGQLLPVGAAGTAIRSVAFFDGAGSAHGLIVLSCWVVAGLALAALSARRAAPVAATD
ncbi:MAG: hypothetical protein QM572_10505 [Nocardioides sp.]|uniref:hypothetical protein n=1 Tax=Nocardioides sp. TaxID=35761 RepID=UPI0039E2C66A